MKRGVYREKLEIDVWIVLLNQSLCIWENKLFYCRLYGKSDCDILTIPMAIISWYKIIV